jgi:hypothetical protein
MLFGPFRPPKPENRILLRYPLDGHGYIFSCTVIIFHPQVCARSLNSGLIVPMRLLLFASPAFELFFPSDGCANVFVILKVEQSLAAIGRSETFQLALLMLDDAQIQVAGDANVKRARMAAENVDVVAGHSKMLAVLVVGPRERSWRARQLRASVVEKARNGMGKISPLGVPSATLRDRLFDSAPLKRCVTR